jgi:hypothetical protein
MAQSQRTLAQLIASVRQISNQETDSPTLSFATDTEITDRIVEAQYELYDLMLAADPDLFMLPTTFTLTSSNVFALSGVPDPGFYRFRGLDFATGGTTPQTVHQFTFAERNRYSGQNFAGTYTLWYTPRLTELVNLTDKLDVFTDNYRKWIIASAAAVIMAKAEESDPSSALADKTTEGMRILGSIAARRAEPEQVPDLTSSDTNWENTGLLDRCYALEGGNLVIR